MDLLQLDDEMKKKKLKLEYRYNGWVAFALVFKAVNKLESGCYKIPAHKIRNWVEVEYVSFI